MSSCGRRWLGNLQTLPPGLKHDAGIASKSSHEQRVLPPSRMPRPLQAGYLLAAWRCSSPYLGRAFITLLRAYAPVRCIWRHRTTRMPTTALDSGFNLPANIACNFLILSSAGVYLLTAGCVSPGVLFLLQHFYTT